MKAKIASGIRLAVLVANIFATGFVTAQEKAEVDRTELPIEAPWYPPITTLDARDAKTPPMFTVKPPKKAPNEVVVLLDDLGFGGTSAFGGVVDTPHFDRLARRGLLYNQFQTTALCSPTRQALVTGRNHHSCNQAKITEIATTFPGATGMLPRDIATVAEMLRHNGDSTAAYKKHHETAVWENRPSGPLARWPNLVGLGEFHGLMGGEANQWAPAVDYSVNRVKTPDDCGVFSADEIAGVGVDLERESSRTISASLCVEEASFQAKSFMGAVQGGPTRDTWNQKRGSQRMQSTRS